MHPPRLRLVTDEHPSAVLDALDEARDGAPDDPPAVLVVDHRTPPTRQQALASLTAPSGTWLVAFTSGSTSAPRAVCRTRASWQASAPVLARLTGTGAATRVLVPGPLSSTLFLHAAWHARAVGAQPVLAPLESARGWDVVHLVPHQLSRLLTARDDLAGRTAVVAGAALPSSTARQAADRGLRLVAYYGAAELSFVALGDPALRPFPGAQVEVRDGEIWVRSPYLALGYARPAGRPDAASPAGPLRLDENGWATVGDRGEVGADGTLVVHGRGTTAVQTGGATVHVADVEHALRRHPGVTDVVVAGVPHAELGQVVAAVVESSTATVAQMRAWARATLAPAARPRRWLVQAHLPRTGAGKPDRDRAVGLLDQA